MLTPARKAKSRCRGSPGTSGSIAWPSLRVAQAPAKSFEVMMMEETPSPARAGRLVSRHRLELGNVERAQDIAKRQHAGGAVAAAGTGRRHDGVAGVEQDGAA